MQRSPERRKRMVLHVSRSRLYRSRASVLAFVLLGVLMASPCEAEPADSDKERVIQRLIEQLASPNTPPSLPRPADDDVPPRYPRAYDHAAQKAILAARASLFKEGTGAFPKLVAAINDQRYSCTVLHNDRWVNMEVGAVCREIIMLQVEVYNRFLHFQRSRFPGNTHWLLVGPYGQDIGKWWNAHKHLTLRDIQLEGVKWAIERERKRGFRYKEEEAAVMGDLERLRKRLEMSKEPIKVHADGKFLDEPDLEPTHWYPGVRKNSENRGTRTDIGILGRKDKRGHSTFPEK